MSDPAAIADDFVVSGSDDLAQEPKPDATAAAAVVVETPTPAGVDGAGETVDESGDDDAADVASDAGRKLANKKGILQARINALTREQHDTKREADAAKAEAARVQRELDDLKAPKPDATETKGPEFYTRPRPQETDIGTKYADWSAYNDDLIEWRIDERDAKKDRETQRRTSEAEDRKAYTAVQERETAFRAEHPDYDTVIKAAIIPKGAQAASTILQHLRYSEFGPHLAYELGKNTKELERIAHLAPGYAIAALGRLEGKIEDRLAAAKSGPAETTEAVTKANPPIKPVGGSPVTSDDGGDPDDLSEAAVNAHIRRENQRLADRRRR